MRRSPRPKGGGGNALRLIACELSQNKRTPSTAVHLHGRQKEEYEQKIEKEQNVAKDLEKKVTALRERLFAVCTDNEARLDYMRSTPIYKLPISYGLQGYLISAGFETLGDVIKLSKKEVAKVNGITPYLRELDAIVWRSGLDYQTN